MRRSLLFVVIFALTLSLGALANSKLEVPNLEKRFGSFLAPNEKMPQELRPLVAKFAQTGAYVAFGTERGFTAASFSSRITHLVLVDHDASVVFYNRVNLALLKASKNREDYLKLRLARKHQDWLLKDWAEQNLDEETSTILKSQDAFKWWKTVMKISDFKQYHRDPGTLRERVLRVSAFTKANQFFSANYLYEEAQYNRLKYLADRNRITVERAEAISPDFPELLSKLTILKDIDISVIDISNAWEPEYMDELNTRGFLKSVEPLVSNKTILLLTARRAKYEARLSVFPRDWVYVGFTFHEIRKHDLREFVTNEIPYSFYPEPVGALLDGVPVGDQADGVYKLMLDTTPPACVYLFQH